MNAIKYLFILLAIFYTTPIFSQEKEKIAKVSYTLFRADNADIPDFNAGIDHGTVSNFSFAYMTKNIEKLNYHEWAISRISNKKSTDEISKTTEQVYAFKYEAGKIGTEINDFMELRFGAALELYYGKSEFESLITSVFSTEKIAAGISITFSPHLDIDVSDRLFIDFNPALMLAYNEIETTRTFDPALPLESQEQSTINLGTGGFVVQLGVGYKF